MLSDSVHSFDFSTIPTDQTAPSWPERRFARFWDQIIPRELATLYGLEYQFRITDFYADFCHTEVMLVVEIDGREYHDELSDLKRDLTLAHRGYQVIRLTARQVQQQPAMCVNRVRAVIRVAYGLPYDGPAQRKYPLA